MFYEDDPHAEFRYEQYIYGKIRMPMFAKKRCYLIEK